MVNDINLKCKTECTGCGACVNVCPVRCISMKESYDGFFFPEIDREVCIKCGQCEMICTPVKHNETYIERTYAAWSNNVAHRKMSSSGGVFAELARTCINEGGVVYGAAFDSDFTVRHERINSTKDLWKIMGSKYVQSETTDCFQVMIDDLKDGRKVLFSGTPCQVDAAARLAEGYMDRFIGIAIICHGVPSPMVWRRYLKFKIGQIGTDWIRSVNFRDKTFGWDNFSLKIQFNSRTYLEPHNTDIYMQGFLENLYLRKSCYSCEYKGTDGISDIVIGDFWGIDKEYPEINSRDGVSAVIIRTDKGKDLWENSSQNIEHIEVKYSQILKHNSVLEKSVDFNTKRSRFYEQIKSGALDEVIRENINLGKLNNGEKYKIYYPILYRYFQNKLNGNSLSDKLKKKHMKKISLYAVTDLLKLVLLELKNDSELNIAISDKNIKKYAYDFPNNPIYTVEELKDKCSDGEIDAVFICNHIYEFQIINELHALGIEKGKLHSIVPLIVDTEISK